MAKVSYSGDLVVNVKDYGATGDGITDDTAAFVAAIAAGNYIYVPYSADGYSLTSLNITDGKTIVGNGNPTIKLSYLSQDNIVDFGNNVICENLTFSVQDLDIEWIRGNIVDSDNVVIRNCGFVGFRNPTQVNSWGVYIERASNITLDQCYFDDNSQSDIAIIDGSTDIQILNSRSNGTLHLNIEPNYAVDKIKNVTVIGGHYSRISLRDMRSVSAHCVESVKLIGLEIDLLSHVGCVASFDSCIIHDMISPLIGITNIYSASIDFGNSIILGKNLIDDPTMGYITSAVGDGHWQTHYAPTSNDLLRVNDDIHGSILRLNPSNGTDHFISLKYTGIPVTETSDYLLIIKSSANYPATTTWNGRHCLVDCYNAGGSLVVSYRVVSTRAAIGESSNMLTEAVAINLISTVTNITIKIATAFNDTGDAILSTTSLDVAHVGLHEIVYAPNVGDSNVPDSTVKTLAPTTPTAYAPAGTNDLYLVGDVIYNDYSASDNTDSWVCTVAGNPGTWVESSANDNYVPLGGGTMTGNLTNQQYVVVGPTGYAIVRRENYAKINLENTGVPKIWAVEKSGTNLAFTDSTLSKTRLSISGTDGTITLGDAVNFALNTTTGTKIGTATNQKLSFYNATPIVQPTELTDELTTITYTAPGTPDYAIQDLTDSGGFGFATKNEGNTALSVIANLQTRVNELETKLVSLGLLADAD
jgi:hypothetical protein